jgi:DNA/RNA-binding domain of Phe-tRNA-synthetase-like protein
MVSDGPEVVVGAVDPRVADALPGVGLVWCEVAVAGDPLRRSSRELRARLRDLSDRARGGRAIAERGHPIPLAYRATLRHLGREERSPAEALTVAYLIRGAYRSRGRLRDALLVATVETEIGVWALDADRLSGAVRLGFDDAPVVADDAGPLAPLFDDPRHVTRDTRRLVLFALSAPGVPDMALAEALWTAAEALV